MCEPVTGISLATWGIIASAAGTAVSAGAAIVGAQAQADQARSQARVSKFLAQDAIDRGRREERAERERMQRILGMQRAAFGASGAVVDVGSALDVLEDTAYFGELDALTIRANAEREAWFHRSNASQARAAASDYVRQGYIGAGVTLLAGAAGTALQGSELGVFGGGGATPQTATPNFYAAPLAGPLLSGSLPRLVTGRGVRTIQ